MKKFFAGIVSSFLLLMMTTQITSAVVASPNYWKLVDLALLPLKPNWTVGSVDVPIASGYFTNLFVGGSQYSDNKLALSSVEVDHGVTSLVPTSVFGNLGIKGLLTGGLRILGLDDDGVTGGISIEGVLGSTSPTGAAVTVVGSKKDGISVQDLSIAEKAFVIKNNDEVTPLMTVDARGQVVSNGGFFNASYSFIADLFGNTQVNNLEVTGGAVIHSRLAGLASTSASASTLDLSTLKNYYHVTGNTPIDCINVGTDDVRSVVYLIFDSNPLVGHNRACPIGTKPLSLAGSVDLNATANTVLTVLMDTYDAREISRTMP